MKFSNHEQGSLEWHQDRLGRITASEFHKLLVAGRSKTKVFGDTAESYIYNIASEIITGMPKADINGVYALEWGKQWEAAARASLEFQTDFKIDQVGFAIADASDNGFGELNNYLGFSADGIIHSEKVGVELKCPVNTEHHLRFICEDEIKKEYIAQMQFSMMVSNYQKWVFASYDHRVKKRPLHFKIVERDNEFILNCIVRMTMAIDAIKEIIAKV